MLAVQKLPSVRERFIIAGGRDGVVTPSAASAPGLVLASMDVETGLLGPPAGNYIDQYARSHVESYTEPEQAT